MDESERTAERERIWTAWRADTIDPPAKSDFDAFWKRQNGIRGLIVIDEVQPLPQPSPFKAYGRALEWGYPTGVGYRYLTLSQAYMLLRDAKLSGATSEAYLGVLVSTDGRNGRQSVSGR